MHTIEMIPKSMILPEAGFVQAYVRQMWRWNVTVGIDIIKEYQCYVFRYVRPIQVFIIRLIVALIPYQELYEITNTYFI